MTQTMFVQYSRPVMLQITSSVFSDDIYKLINICEFKEIEYSHILIVNLWW